MFTYIEAMAMAFGVFKLIVFSSKDGGEMITPIWGGPKFVNQYGSCMPVLGFAVYPS